jgi:hypothetical protein
MLKMLSLFFSRYLRSLPQKIHESIERETYFDLYSILRYPLESLSKRSEIMHQAINYLERGYLHPGLNFVNILEPAFTQLNFSESLCHQFHQHFTHAFYEQNFGAKNFKAETFGL